MGTCPLRFGVLGCGAVTCRRFLPALGEVQGATLAAIASRSHEKAAAVAAVFGGEPVEGYAALIARDDVDVVYIALPVGLHAQWAIAAAQRGKHVLCEKSLARDGAETQRVIAACEAAGVALLEGYAYQYHPQHQYVREMIAAGRIGEPIMFHACFGFPPIDSPHRYDRALGGGALLDAGGYTLHAARRCFAREPERVSASLQGRGGVDTRGAVLLDFGKGRSAELAFGFEHAYRNFYSIWGSKGNITVDRRVFSIPAQLPPVVVVEAEGQREEITLVPNDHFAAEIEVFCAGHGDAVIRRRWVEEARRQAALLDAVRRAARNEAQ